MATTIAGIPLTGEFSTSSNPAYQPAELFGGAITAMLPSNFFDASMLRKIPDNQEVYLDRDGLSSIVIDLGERVAAENIQTDEQAFAFHIEDVADPKDRLCVGGLHRMMPTHLPNAPAYYTVATTKPLSLSSASTLAEDDQVKFTAMFILLLRLAEKKTDILITVNVPYRGLAAEANLLEGDPDGRPAELDVGHSITRTLLESFQIIDWSLFVEE